MKISRLARVEAQATLGDNVVVWDNSHIRSGAQIGGNSVIGENVYVGSSVIIGRNVKIQNNSLIYEGSIIEDGVFVGPGVIMTNDHNPRAVNVDLSLKSSRDWDKSSVFVREGASIGAGAVLISPVSIGKWALIGAGSVVTKDVADYALVVGNPAQQVGWVGPSGIKLSHISDGVFECPKTMTRFELIEDILHEMIIR